MLKKIVFLFFVVILFVPPSQAQIYMGVHSGMSGTTIHLIEDGTLNHRRYYADPYALTYGINAKYRMANGRFGFGFRFDMVESNGDVNYSSYNKVDTYTGSELTYKRHIGQIVIPHEFIINKNKHDRYNLSLNLGPYWAWRIKSRSYGIEYRTIAILNDEGVYVFPREEWEVDRSSRGKIADGYLGLSGGIDFDFHCFSNVYLTTSINFRQDFRRQGYYNRHFLGTIGLSYRFDFEGKENS
jgi:hypothetical protein